MNNRSTSSASQSKARAQVPVINAAHQEILTVQKVLDDVDKMDVCELRDEIKSIDPQFSDCKVDEAPKWRLVEALRNIRLQQHVYSTDKILEEGKVIFKNQWSNKCAYASQKDAATMHDDMIIASCANWEMYAVFDGHTGNNVVLALKKYFPYRLLPKLVHSKNVVDTITSEFLAYDQKMFRGFKNKRSLAHGASACIALFDTVSRKLYLCNMGNAKGILLNSQGKVIVRTPVHSAQNALEAGMANYWVGDSGSTKGKIPFGVKTILGWQDNASEIEKTVVTNIKSDLFYNDYLDDFNRIISNMTHKVKIDYAQSTYALQFQKDTIFEEVDSKVEAGKQIAEKMDYLFGWGGEFAAGTGKFTPVNTPSILRVINRRANTRSFGDSEFKSTMDGEYTSSDGLISAQPHVEEISGDQFKIGSIYHLMMGTDGFWASYAKEKDVISEWKGLKSGKNRAEDACPKMVNKKPENDDNVAFMYIKMKPIIRK